MNSDKCVRCKDCGKTFMLKDETEYIMSWCDGCSKLIVLYKFNPAILSREGDNAAVFLSSDPQSKCRKCGALVTIKNKDDYYSIRCVNCGFGLIYKMDSHRGIGRYISRGEFDKTLYWLSGKRKLEREERDAKNKR